MSFASETRERVRPVLPLAAMVDVLFLLLIFFMTASVFREAEAQIQVQLPEAGTGTAAVSRTDQITVNIQADNSVYLGEREVAIDDLAGELARLVTEAQVRSVVVRGDAESNVGVFVKVMDLAQQAGVEEVSAATVRPIRELE